MLILGADPDELNAAAQLLTAHAEEYDRADKQIAYWLQRMGWTGSEADRVRAAYRSRMGPQLRSTASELRHAATELRANAALQQAASTGNTNTTPSRPAPPDKQDPFQDLTPPHRRWTREELDALGIGSVMGTPASLALSSPKVAGWTGGPLAAASIYSLNPLDFSSLLADLNSFDGEWNDEESIKKGLRGSGSAMFGTGVVLSTTVFGTFLGLGLMTFGGALYAGSYIDGDHLVAAYEFGKRVGGAFGDVREDLINVAGDGFEWVGDRVDDIGGAVGDVKEDLINVAGDGFEWVGDRVDDIGGAVGDVKEDLINVAGDGFEWVGDRVDDIGGAVGDVKEDLINVAGDGFEWVGDRVDDIGGALSGAKNWGVDKTGDLVSGLKGLFGGDDG